MSQDEHDEHERKLEDLSREELIARFQAELQSFWNDTMSHIRLGGRGAAHEAAAPIRARWKHHPDFPGTQVTVGRTCSIWLEPRPSSRDRGLYIAHLEAWGELFIDGNDGWSRYYFDELRAKQEIDAWLDARGQMLGEGEVVQGIPERMRKRLPRSWFIDLGLPW